MGKYFLNHYRIFYTGDDPDVSTAFTAGFYVYVEYPLQSFCPGH